MIKRIIKNSNNLNLEVVTKNGLIGLRTISDHWSDEYYFDNDEDIHCFISELQSEMLRAKEDPKKDMCKYKVEPLLCMCGKPMFTDRCTSRGCNNWNVFGQGTVDTTSNGTE